MTKTALVVLTVGGAFAWFVRDQQRAERDAAVVTPEKVEEGRATMIRPDYAKKLERAKWDLKLREFRALLGAKVRRYGSRGKPLKTEVK